MSGGEAGEGEDEFFGGALGEEVDGGGVRLGAFDYADQRGFEGWSWAYRVVVVEGALGGGGEACVALEEGVEGWLDCFGGISRREHRELY